MYLIRSVICILCIICSICYGADDYVVGPDLFRGEWANPCTKSIITIIVEPNSSIFDINIQDTSKFARTFTINDIKWNGDELSFTAICNETNHTTHHKMEIISPCQLRDHITGDSKASTNWRKTICQVPNGS